MPSLLCLALMWGGGSEALPAEEPGADATQANTALVGGPPISGGPPAFLLTAPVPVPRASYFHAALEVPPLEGARTLPQWAGLVRLETSHVRSVGRQGEDGVESRFDGLFHEWAALRLQLGLLPRLEAQARTALAGWDEKLDRFGLLDESGNPIVTNEDDVVLDTGASNRHDNISEIVLGLKALLLRQESSALDLALATSVKIPIARPHDLTNAGTTDLNVTLLASAPLGPVTVHANLGVGVPFGEQSLFVDEADVELTPFVHGGVAVAWTVSGGLALIAQVEANSSAFGDVPFLEDPPLTVAAGVRKQLGRFFLEVGGGTGLIASSSYDYALHVAVSYAWGGPAPP